MEATEKNKAENWDRKARQLNELSGRAAVTLAELYRRQFSLIADFYSNFLGMALRATNMPGAYFVSPEGLKRESWQPGNFPFWPVSLPGGFFKSFADEYQTMVRQIIESNRGLLNSLQEYSWTGKAERNSADNYRRLTEDEMDVTKGMVNSIADAYTRQMNLFFEINKKMFQELSGQVSRIVEDNETFLNNITKMDGEETGKEKTSRKPEKESQKN